MTINTRTDDKGHDRYRAVVRIKDGDKWRSIASPWTRNKGEAVRAERDLHTRRDRGQLAKASNLSVNEYLHEWLRSVSKVATTGGRLAPTTRAKYVDHLRWADPWLDGIALTRLRASHVETMRDGLLEETRTDASGKTRPRFAPSTVGAILGTVGRALDAAVRRHQIAENPADPKTVLRPNSRAKVVPAIPFATARAILDAVEGHDTLDAAVHLGLGLGMRREEVLGLRWSDVDFKTGAVSVSLGHVLTYAHGSGLHWGDPKSSSGARVIHAPAYVMDALRRHKAGQAKRRLRLGDAWALDTRGDGGEVSDLVVDDGAGRRWFPASFSKLWSRFAEARDWDAWSFHGLRHGRASLFVLANVPDAIALEVLGHSATPILRRYQHATTDAVRAALEL